MAKVLGMVSTPYHLLVFLFIKDAFLTEDEVDLVVTDKTASMEALYHSGRLEPYFHKVFFADGRKIKNPYKSAPVTFWESFVHNGTTDRILSAPLGRYDRMYLGSPGMPDEIAKEIAKTLIRKNRKLSFHRFEDGFASYTKKPVHIINTPSGRFLYRILLRYDITQMEKEILFFEPEMAEREVDFEKHRIPQTQERIRRVTEMAKEIFQFEAHTPSEEVIFLGQGAKNASGNPDTYQRLVRRLRDIAGDDHFVIKPHPRGIYDDFHGELQVYEDPCPVELAIASGEMEEKTLISFYSTACVAGKLLFHSKCRILFLYPLAEDAFNEKCDYEHYFNSFSRLCENVHIARSWADVERLLRPGVE
ncbi:MAG: alpha-2,8-polysialyltransferase family protein [Lachnospiraceae bacterium]|nr:alpha-2,8-polysialyltransferase family protein [Lachnospiraceae bacterium]